MGVRLESEVKSNRRDLNHLTEELDRRDTYVETVKHRRNHKKRITRKTRKKIAEIIQIVEIIKIEDIV